MLPIPPPLRRLDSHITFSRDVLTLIVATADHQTQKQLRLCCQWLAAEAAIRIFSVTHVDLRPSSMSKVTKLANSHYVPASAIKTLEVLQTDRLLKWDLDEWCRIIQQSCCWAVPLNKHNIEAMGQLYQEYEADREAPSIYSCMNFPDHDIPEDVMPEGSQRAASSRIMEHFHKACVDFEKALLKLSRLRELKVFCHRDRIGPWRATYYWRGYSFNIPFRARKGYPYYDQARPECIAPLEFILRALGKRNSISNSLESIRFLFRSGWWAPYEFEDVWASESTSIMVGEAFIHLKHLNITTSVYEHIPELATTLGGYLYRASNLETFFLEVIQAPGVHLIDILASLDREAQWPRLKSLHLSFLDFSMASLLSTPNHLAPTLRALTLRDCALMEAHESWQEFYEKMRNIQFGELRYLNFGNCTELTETEVDPSDMLCPLCEVDLPIAHFMGVRNSDPFFGYPPGLLYSYILKETDVMPPLKYFTQDLQEAHYPEAN